MLPLDSPLLVSDAVLVSLLSCSEFCILILPNTSAPPSCWTRDTVCWQVHLHAQMFAYAVNSSTRC